jgi:hypothetical protein
VDLSPTRDDSATQTSVLKQEEEERLREGLRRQQEQERERVLHHPAHANWK